MAVNKVKYGDTTVIDISDTTAISSDVVSGKYFYTGGGVKTEGTASTRSSSDLSSSGATVSAPAGYYAATATISINSGSATTPNTTITANPSISVSSSGLITASASTAASLTPNVSAGYIATGSAGTVTINGSSTSQLSTVAGTTINPTESQQTAVASGKYTTGDVKVGAISNTYIGSGIATQSSANLTVSGSTVTAPAGYYSSNATKSVASGTEGTPSASKGTVTNHSISVTPSVTNTAGYISGGTKTGTAVTVSASELVSSTLSLSTTGVADCTNYKGVNVNIPFSTIRTGTSAPSSSLGTDGDIYIQTS